MGCKLAKERVPAHDPANDRRESKPSAWVLSGAIPMSEAASRPTTLETALTLASQKARRPVAIRQRPSDREHRAVLELLRVPLVPGDGRSAPAAETSAVELPPTLEPFDESTQSPDMLSATQSPLVMRQSLGRTRASYDWASLAARLPLATPDCSVHFSTSRLRPDDSPSSTNNSFFFDCGGHSATASTDTVVGRGASVDAHNQSGTDIWDEESDPAIDPVDGIDGEFDVALKRASTVVCARG